MFPGFGALRCRKCTAFARGVGGQKRGPWPSAYGVSSADALQHLQQPVRRQLVGLSASRDCPAYRWLRNRRSSKTEDIVTTGRRKPRSCSLAQPAVAPANPLASRTSLTSCAIQRRRTEFGAPSRASAIITFSGWVSKRLSERFFKIHLADSLAHTRYRFQCWNPILVSDAIFAQTLFRKSFVFFPCLLAVSGLSSDVGGRSRRHGEEDAQQGVRFQRLPQAEQDDEEHGKPRGGGQDAPGHGGETVPPAAKQSRGASTSSSEYESSEFWQLPSFVVSHLNHAGVEYLVGRSRVVSSWKCVVFEWFPTTKKTCCIQKMNPIHSSC